MSPLAESGGTSIHPKTRPDSPYSTYAPNKESLRQSDLQPKRVKTVTFNPAGFRPMRQASTKLVNFETAPFPYNGVFPGTGKPFLDVSSGNRKGHQAWTGRVFWQDETYNDRRVLLHIPKGFDINRPAVAVLFFHGHGAKLERDIRDRQMLPEQVSASGSNAVLIAPQFAVDAPDSSAGKFWEEGGCARFYDEAAQQLSRMYGAPDKARMFASMPIVVVSYSGGFVPAASCLEKGNLKAEVRGVVLMDALYGELETFANWISKSRSAFFVSVHTDMTSPRNAELKRMLSEQHVAYSNELNGESWRRGVTFVSTGSDANHKDYLTQAWVKYPIKDALVRIGQWQKRYERNPDAPMALSSVTKIMDAEKINVKDDAP